MILKICPPIFMGETDYLLWQTFEFFHNERLQIVYNPYFLYHC